MTLPVEEVERDGRTWRTVPKTVREFASILDADLKGAGYGPFMTRHQVRDALGVSMRTIDRYARMGVLTSMRLRAKAHPLFRRREIALVLASRK